MSYIPEMLPSREPRPRRILLAEDDSAMRAMLGQVLRREGHDVTECSDGGALLLHLAPLVDGKGDVAFDMVVSDIRMPGLTAMEILEGLDPREAHPPIVLITAFGDAKTHAAARRCGAAVLLDKPFEIGKLLSVIRSLPGTPGQEANGGRHKAAKRSANHG